MPADRLIMLYRVKLAASDQFHHALLNALRGTPIKGHDLQKLSDESKIATQAYNEFSQSLITGQKY